MTGSGMCLSSDHSELDFTEIHEAVDKIQVSMVLAVNDTELDAQRWIRRRTAENSSVSLTFEHYMLFSKHVRIMFFTSVVNTASLVLGFCNAARSTPPSSSVVFEGGSFGLRRYGSSASRMWHLPT